MKVALVLVVTVGVAIGASLPAPVATSTPAVTVVTDERDEPRGTVLERSPQGHFYAFAEVNGATVRFLVDTGASVVALTQEDARRAGIGFDPHAFRSIARGASGPVRGQEVRLDRLALGGESAKGLTAVVLEGAETSLLGQNFLRRMAVEIRDDRMTLKKG